MRTGFKIFLLVAVLAAAGYGLLAPVVASSHLHDYANTAAQAGYSKLSSSSGPTSVQSAVAASVAGKSNVSVKSVQVRDGVVTVVLVQKVHNYMSSFPGLEHWFTVTASESASATG